MTQIEDPTRFEELPPDAPMPSTSQFPNAVEEDGVGARAEQLKKQGNDAFANRDYENAVSLYREALWALPRLQQPSHDAGRRRSEPPKEEEEEEEEQDEPESKSEEPSEEVKRLRATLNANTAIAWIKLERWEDAASACNDALRDQPEHVKALLRRAQANEKRGNWSALEQALQDWTKAAELQPSDNRLQRDAAAATKRLSPMIDKQKEIETAEMMGKFKDLGNSVLGYFGMNVDQFKFDKKPDGGYSLNMN